MDKKYEKDYYTSRSKRNRSGSIDSETAPQREKYLKSDNVENDDRSDAYSSGKSEANGDRAYSEKDNKHKKSKKHKKRKKHKHKKSSVVDSYFKEEEAEEQERNGKKEGEPKCESEKDYLQSSNNRGFMISGN